MQKRSMAMWVMVALGALVYLTNFTDKTVISAMSPSILKADHINKIALGVIFTAFSITYTIFQIPFARAIDRWGHRVGVGLLTLWYGLFTIVTGFVTANVNTMAVVRALVGVGESASMPAVTGGLTKWVPRELRGLAQGVMHAFTRIGAAITLPVSVYSYMKFGIKGPFVAIGIATLIISFLWAVIFRNHPRMNTSVRTAPKPAPFSWRILLGNKSLWALCLADFCYFYTLTIYLTWFPTFLVVDRHFTMLKVGIVGGLPFIGGAIGGILGGQISDYMGKRTGNYMFWRHLVPFIGMVGSVILILPAAYSNNKVLIITLFTLSFFFLDATISVFWAIAMDIGQDNAGTVASIMNTWANIGGILSPMVFGILVQMTGSWTLPFLVSSVLMLIGAGLVWLIKSDKAIGSGDTPATGELSSGKIST